MNWYTMQLLNSPNCFVCICSVHTVLVLNDDRSCCRGWSTRTNLIHSLNTEFIFSTLLEILHFERGGINITAVALPPGLLLVSTAIPPQALNIVVSHRCTTIIFGWLPSQSHNALGHINDFDSCGRIRRICNNTF